MPFTGKEGRPISRGTARKWVKNWANDNPDTTQAIFFGKDNLQALLNESGSMGIRVYFAKDDAGDNRLVLIAADSDENNILPTSDELESGGGVILDDGKVCPVDCGNNNI